MKNSLKIYKTLNVIRKDLDSEEEVYALLKIGKKSYDVLTSNKK